MPCGAQTAETITIDQIGALAGRISPGDAPGFPITLNRGGHYRLSGDLRVPANTSGIVITAPNVTLDLSNHSVSGPVTCSHDKLTLEVRCDAASRFSAIVGVSSVGTACAVIRNGTVQGFAGLGVHYGEGTLLENLRVRSNAGVGIAGAGYAAAGLVRATTVQHNGGPGIACEQMHISHSSFVANGGTGVDCRGAWFVGSVTRHNGAFGVAEGGKAGLRSFGNRLGDEAGVAADRLPVLISARR
jgi:hypothetical protein